MLCVGVCVIVPDGVLFYFFNLECSVTPSLHCVGEEGRL